MDPLPWSKAECNRPQVPLPAWAGPMLTAKSFAAKSKERGVAQALDSLPGPWFLIILSHSCSLSCGHPFSGSPVPTPHSDVSGGTSLYLSFKIGVQAFYLQIAHISFRVFTSYVFVTDRRYFVSDVLLLDLCARLEEVGGFPPSRCALQSTRRDCPQERLTAWPCSPLLERGTTTMRGLWRLRVLNAGLSPGPASYGDATASEAVARAAHPGFLPWAPTV